MEKGWGIFWLSKQQKKGAGGGLGFKALLGGGGSLFLEFPSLLDSLVVCMCCCNPFPYPPPHVSLMYINPDSRGQCVLGEVKLLSSQSITFNLHSSACGCRSGREMCLAFPKTGCFLGVNQRDTHGPGRP